LKNGGPRYRAGRRTTHWGDGEVSDLSNIAAAKQYEANP